VLEDEQSFKHGGGVITSSLTNAKYYVAKVLRSNIKNEKNYEMKEN
jgi:hypothetical protein